MIIDFHTHIFPPWLRERRQHLLGLDPTFDELYRNPRAKMATAEELVEAMEEDGVSRSVVMGIGWSDFGLAREANDYIVECVRRYPQQLTGFAGVNPAWGSKAAAEAERCALAGLVGLGELHPDTQAFDLGDADTMAPLVEVVRHRKLVLTTHSSEPVGHLYSGKGKTGPEVLWRFAENYPDVALVCAHWGGGLPFYALMPEVAAGLRNVYFDTAAWPLLYTSQALPTVASLAGVDKILMGSDFPLVRARRVLSMVEASPLSVDEKRAVKGGNAVALLRV